MPPVECLSQMPKYAKFLNELISNKKKLQEFEIVTLTKECSIIILNKLSLKRKHLRSLTIPYFVENLNFQRSLYDLGASINLIPLSVYRKLGLGEAKPTHKYSISTCRQNSERPRRHSGRCASKGWENYFFQLILQSLTLKMMRRSHLSLVCLFFTLQEQLLMFMMELLH